MTEIYLVRHGHSPYSEDEFGRGLSLKGKRSRRELAFLGEKKIEAIYSSPMKRCQATIAPLAKELKLEPILVADLRERLASPTRLEPFAAALNYLWAQPLASFPGGESNVVAQRRVVQAITEIAQAHPMGDVVVSTHGNLLALLINYYDASAGLAFWQSLNFPGVVHLSLGDTQVDYRVLL